MTTESRHYPAGATFRAFSALDDLLRDRPLSDEDRAEALAFVQWIGKTSSNDGMTAEPDPTEETTPETQEAP